jgi:hypothetical protein
LSHAPLIYRSQPQPAVQLYCSVKLWEKIKKKHNFANRLNVHSAEPISNPSGKIHVGGGGDGALLAVFGTPLSAEVDVNRQVLVNPVVNPFRRLEPSAIYASGVHDPEAMKQIALQVAV